MPKKMKVVTVIWSVQHFDETGWISVSWSLLAEDERGFPSVGGMDLEKVHAHHSRVNDNGTFVASSIPH